MEVEICKGKECPHCHKSIVVTCKDIASVKRTRKAARTHMSWSGDKLQVLKDMVARKVAYKDIAKYFGVTTRAIHQQVYTKNIK